MSFSVVLLHGGDFQNVNAPIKVQAGNYKELQDQIKDNFGIDQNDELMISYCGMLLSSKTELPQTNGAPLFVSVRQNIQSKSAFGSEKKEDAPFNKAIPDALQYIQKIMNPRAPPNQREIVVDVIRNVLDRRWKKYPDMCRKDPAGADLASKAERFLQLLDPKIIRKHEIIGTLLVDIHRISQQKLLHTIKANPTNPTNAQNPNQAGTVPTASPFINAANNQAGQSRPGPITANMLQQALQAAANNMQATGQTVQSSLSGQNQNLQQAAQGVVGEIAALAQAVENGINQLREMGILEMTTEEEARRILQENGGNVETAINVILQ